MKNRKKSTKILWVSRHVPSNEQMEDLRSIFGNVTVIRISQTFNTGGDVAVTMKRQKADEVVVVLPMQMVAQLIRAGVKPLRAVMRRASGQSEDIPKYEHIGFERILSIDVVTERMQRK